MERWQDHGLILSARPHGESGAVVSVLTESHGRANGYVQGARGSKLRGVIEAGNLVQIEWSARDEHSLGSFRIEQDRNLTVGYMHDSMKLISMRSMMALCDAALPERENHAPLYHGTLAQIDALDRDLWGVSYVMWEVALLKELGFALDFTRCAAGGDPMTLSHISPKSGCAVSEEKAAPYEGKLLPLPSFLKPHRQMPDDLDVLKGLEMGCYFLEHWVFAQHTRGIPEDRLRFQDKFAKYVGDLKNTANITDGAEELHDIE